MSGNVKHLARLQRPPHPLLPVFHMSDIAAQLRGRDADVLIDVASEMGASWAELSAHTSMHGKPWAPMAIRTKEDFPKLLRNAEQRFAGSDLALRWGRRVGLQALGSLGMVFMSAETIGAAAAYFLKLHHLLQVPFKLDHHVVGDEVWMCVVYPPEMRLRPTSAFHADCLSAICVTALSTVLGRPAKALRYLTPRRSCMSEQPYLDLVTHEVSDAPDMHYTLVYPSAVLSETIVTRNKSLEREHRQVFESALDARQPKRQMSEDVRAMLQQRLAEPPSLEEAASLLGVSARALRRELEREGQTYRLLLRSLRRDHAQALLRSGKSVKYVGASLGFTDAANFRKAFRQWTSRAPSSWREGEVSA